MRYFRAVSLMAALILAAACLGQAYPFKSRYNLPAPSEVSAPAWFQTENGAADRRTLLIGAVTAAPGYDGRGLVYRLGPNRYESDFHHEFIAPPTRLLAEAEAVRLTLVGRRLRAVSSPGLALADFGLETHIRHMYGDYARTPPRAVLTLRFIFNDLRSAAPRVLLDRTYVCAKPLAIPDPGGLVAAFGLCLTEILDDLAGALDKEV